jgi:hypothetical protein
MTDQEEEARKSVARAWELREKASGYVVPRIIYFQILLLMLDNQDFSFGLRKSMKSSGNHIQQWSGIYIRCWKC